MEKFQLLPLFRSLSTLVRAFYAAQIRIDDGKPDDINSRISQRFRGTERQEGGRMGEQGRELYGTSSHKYPKFTLFDCSKANG